MVLCVKAAVIQIVPSFQTTKTVLSGTFMLCSVNVAKRVASTRNIVFEKYTNFSQMLETPVFSDLN